MSKSGRNAFIQILREELLIEWVSLVTLELLEVVFAFVAIVINFDSSLFVLEKIPLSLNVFNEYSRISYSTIDR